MNKKALISGLNRLHSDRVECVCKYTIIVYAKGKLENIDDFLRECSKAGFLEITKSVKEAENQENCIRLISRITNQ